MTSRQRWGVLLSFSLVACGGAVGDSESSPPPADSAGSTDGRSPPPAATSDGKPAAKRPSTGVVWVQAAASSFDARACSEPIPGADFFGLNDYLSAQMGNAGLTGATISAGGGVCHGESPTSMSVTYVFMGTVAAVEALKATPPAPFRGTYVTVPLVVKQAQNVKFEFFVKVGEARVFDDVWVHQGLSFDGEAAFISDVCNKKESFDAAIVTSPVGPAVKAWLGGQGVGSVYGLGYDATFTFVDGTTTKISNAYRAVSGPYLAPCPNLVASP